MKEILQYKIIEIGTYSLRVQNIIFLFAAWIIVLFVLKLIKRSINKTAKINDAKKYSIYSLIRYLIYVVTFILSFQILGVELSILLAGSAALLVGLGLGIQNLFSDYISGIIILFDSTVKVGDIIETNGLVCKVEDINLRTTTVLTRDEKYIILPNTDLTRNQLINWTHNTKKARFEVNVGVEYGSDVNKVMNILKTAAAEISEILKDPEPFVRFNDFGDSALLFTVYFWSEDVFRVESVKSELRIIINSKLSENNITIPFPQRVIHTKT